MLKITIQKMIQRRSTTDPVQMKQLESPGYALVRMYHLHNMRWLSPEAFFFIH